MALIAMTALAIAGCSDDSDETASSSTSTSTATEAGESALPEPITAEGAERVKLADVLQREVHLPDEPDWMVEAFGSLWTIKGNGDVIRVDPETGKVIAEISKGEFSDPLCQGIGASDDSIWACPARGDPVGRVVRIDPERNEIVSTLKTLKMQDQGRLIAAAGNLWLLSEHGDRLVGVDLDTERQAAEIKLGETCTDLAGGSVTTLFLMCPIDGHVLSVDPETAKVTGEGDFPGARTGWFTGDDLWVGLDGGTAQADPESLEIEALYDTHPAYDGRVYATEDEVLTREGEGANFLTRIDPAAQRITEIVEQPRAKSGGDVIVVDGSIWTTTYDDSVMYQLER
jgi:streptogramin lyase